jgi:hypothetical protein
MSEAPACNATVAIIPVLTSSARRVRQQIKVSAESRERKRNEKQEVAGPKREGGRAREAGGSRAEEGRWVELEK